MAKRKPKQKPIEEQDYKELLTACLTLKRATGKVLYDLIVRLVLVYDKEEYRKFCRQEAEDPAEFLDQYVNEVANRTFVGLMLMYKKFPERNTWEEGKIQELYEATLEEIQGQEVEVEAGTRTSYKAVAAELNEEKAILQNRVNQLEAELVAVRDQLQRTTEDLRTRDLENATLNGRLTEIEKLLEKFKVSEAA